MKQEFEKSLNILIKKIKETLKNNLLSIYLYGSIVLGDFKLGWSDIDILVLTKDEIDAVSAQKLLYLRQELLKEEPNNLYYRSFEGGMLSLNGFINKTQENVVYWGTKGEKIKQQYLLDSFSAKQLIESAKLAYGKEVRKKFKMPSYENLCQDILNHYLTIRNHAVKTDRNLYSFGWLLDISRCIYTLKTGEIIAKTKAGEWALKNKLCPDKKALKTALKVRKKPQLKNKTDVMDYAETLGPTVQKYANVLEKYLYEYKVIDQLKHD